jgi:hypothetical protein
MGATITVKAPTAISMVIWLRLFHGAVDQLPLASVSIAELWHVLLAAHNHRFDPKRLSGWFAEWYNAKQRQAEDSLLSRRQMLFPCFAFEHTEAFLKLTKWVVYHSQTILWNTSQPNSFTEMSSSLRE